MKRGVIIVFLVLSLLVLQLSFISADNHTSDLQGFEKSYACLEDEVKEKGVDALNLEEQQFALLALGYDTGLNSELKSAILAQGEDNCWPEESCNIKATALSLLALDHVGQDTEDIELWLLNNTRNPRDLVWFLQIDQTGEDTSTKCTISYGDTERTITLGADKKISGSAGACFRFANDGYWLEVERSCYDQEFSISCEDDFVTSLLYKTRQDATYYVSALSNTGIPDSITTEKVESLCFGTTSSCDYEGTLWAMLAMKKAGRDYEAYVPYLISLSSDNGRNLPSAFLYMGLGYDEYFDELISEQKQEGYWQTSTGKRFFDTALALLALQDRSVEQANTALDYLLETMPESGCWATIRDTSFLLFSASPKNPAKGITTTSRCGEFDYTCVATEDECGDAGGEVFDNYVCTISNPYCCSKEPAGPTCSEKDGTICSSTQDCTGSFVSSSDSSYCCTFGDCVAAVVEKSDCEKAGNTCKSSCLDNEDERTVLTSSCSGLDRCCGPEQKKQGSLWWLWLLIILIIIVAVLIIFRDKLLPFWYTLKSKFSKKKPPQNSPAQKSKAPARPLPKFGPGRGPVVRTQNRPVGAKSAPGPISRPPLRPRPGTPPFTKQRELDNTLKKLKEMGK